ncbi:DUF222 domain-containing protein [Nakamurella alba]|nr:DUF222 domain-containing protein [Nakamurella alba]
MNRRRARKDARKFKDRPMPPADACATTALKALTTLDPTKLHGSTLVDGIVAGHRAISYLHARMQPWLAELLSPELIPTAEGLLRHGAAAHADHPETIRAAAARRTMAAAEVAAGLVVSHITGGNHLGRAAVLVQDLPATLAMLERGALDMYRAKMIAERALRLDNPDLIPAFEQRALALVPGRSPGQLEKLLDRIIIDLQPKAESDAEDRAYTARQTGRTDLEHAMSRFYADITTEAALMIENLIDMIARTLGDDRTLPQRRADVLVAIFDRLAHGETISVADILTIAADLTNNPDLINQTNTTCDGDSETNAADDAMSGAAEDDMTVTDTDAADAADTTSTGNDAADGEADAADPDAGSDGHPSADSTEQDADGATDATDTDVDSHRAAAEPAESDIDDSNTPSDSKNEGPNENTSTADGPADHNSDHSGATDTPTPGVNEPSTTDPNDMAADDSVDVTEDPASPDIDTETAMPSDTAESEPEPPDGPPPAHATDQSDTTVPDRSPEPETFTSADESEQPEPSPPADNATDQSDTTMPDDTNDTETPDTTADPDQPYGPLTLDEFIAAAVPSERRPHQGWKPIAPFACKCAVQPCEIKLHDRDGEPLINDPIATRKLDTRPATHLVLTMDLDTYTDLAQHPGHLKNYGSISPDLARTIAAQLASVQLVIIDPATGAPLGASDRTYTPGIALARKVRLLSPTCTWIGCSKPAERCDIDHHIPYNHDDPTAGGPTALWNTEPACRTHHRLKTLTGWRITHHPDRTATFTSPLGRDTYRAAPAITDPTEWANNRAADDEDLDEEPPF